MPQKYIPLCTFRELGEKIMAEASLLLFFDILKQLHWYLKVRRAHFIFRMSKTLIFVCAARESKTEFPLCVCIVL